MKRFAIVFGSIAAGVVMLVMLGLMLRVVRDREWGGGRGPVAFADPAPPTPAEAAEFGRFFADFGAACARGDEAAATAAIDPDRAAGEIIRLGVFDRPGVRLTASDRADLARWVREDYGHAMASADTFHWRATRVRAVRWSADRRAALVSAAHRSDRPEAREEMTARWWLARHGGGWRVYDHEDLGIGTRYSSWVAPYYVPEPGAGGEAVRDRLLTRTEAVRVAATSALRNDPDGADRHLGPARGADLPPAVAAARELADARIALHRNDPAAALARLDAADRLAPGVPAAKAVRSNALNRAGRYEEALAQARGFVGECGPDGFVMAQAGYALEGLNRPAEAAAEFRRALDEDADEPDALSGLRRVLPADRKGEIGDRLAAARDPGRTYDDLAREARRDGDAAGAAALLAGLRKARPDDPRVSEAEVRDLVQGEKYAEAAALVRRRVGDAPAGAALPGVLVAYLDAMLAADRAAEALAAVPPAHAGPAFRFLADDLDDRRFDGDPKAAPPDPADDPLAALVAARRKEAPGDPWAWYYEAAGQEAAGRFADAAKTLAAGAAALDAAADPPPDADRERFRTRRVFVLFQAKQGPAALADVGPAGKTFRQLGWLYAGAKDADGLAALADAHAAAHPDDRAIVYFRAETHWLKGEYAAAARLFGDYRVAAAEADDPHPGTATDREVRARVRAGDAAGARRVVSGLPGDRQPPVLRALVALASGDADELGHVLGDAAKTPGGAGFLYWDEDCSRLVAAPAFEPVRRRFPDPRPAPPPGPAG